MGKTHILGIDQHEFLERSRNIKMDCSYNSDGIIELTVKSFMGEISRKIIDTQEAQVREALIALGWTPPKDKA